MSQQERDPGLAARAKSAGEIETDVEAGRRLFQAGKYEQAFELLGPASDWLQERGRVREGLALLEPFLTPAVQAAMDRALVDRLFGSVGTAHHRLSRIREAMGYYEQRLAIAREIGNRSGEGKGLGCLGLAYADLGEREKARRLFSDSLAIGKAIRDPDIVREAEANLADLAEEEGESS
jgi:tetratricopeptide (TPR) repeat protein